MKNMYTWAARPVRRNLTVADMRAAKGVRKLVQVTASSEEEASAAAAGLDFIDRRQMEGFLDRLERDGP